MVRINMRKVPNYSLMNERQSRPSYRITECELPSRPIVVKVSGRTVATCNRISARICSPQPPTSTNHVSTVDFMW